MAERTDCCRAARKTDDRALRRGGLGMVGYEKFRCLKRLGGWVLVSSFVEDKADAGWEFENPFRSTDDQACLALTVLELVAVVELEWKENEVLMGLRRRAAGLSTKYLLVGVSGSSNWCRTRLIPGGSDCCLLGKISGRRDRFVMMNGYMTTARDYVTN